MEEEGSPQWEGVLQSCNPSEHELILKQISDISKQWAHYSELCKRAEENTTRVISFKRKVQQHIKTYNTDISSMRRSIDMLPHIDEAGNHGNSVADSERKLDKLLKIYYQNNEKLQGIDGMLDGDCKKLKKTLGNMSDQIDSGLSDMGDLKYRNEMLDKDVGNLTGALRRLQNIINAVSQGKVYIEKAEFRQHPAMNTEDHEPKKPTSMPTVLVTEDHEPKKPTSIPTVLVTEELEPHLESKPDIIHDNIATTDSYRSSSLGPREQLEVLQEEDEYSYSSSDSDERQPRERESISLTELDFMLG